MIKPFALYIGLRYTRAKRRNHFISFISMSSLIGIALGVTVLITVLSVMNGFEHEIRGRFFSMARQITVSDYVAGMPDWQQWRQRIETQPNVKEVAPFVLGQGILTHLGLVHPVLVNGIVPQAEARISQVADKMVAGSLDNLRAGKFGIVLGKRLAEGLGLSVGDKVNLVTPQATASLVGIIPRFKRFTVVGIFSVGHGFGVDRTWAFIHLGDAQRLFQLGERVSGLWLKVTDLYQAPQVAKALQTKLPEAFTLTNWTQDYGALFQAINMEKTMIFLLLLLIIAVAAFNLVSSLVMMVSDKRADIAILRTLGATPRTIMGVFMVQGCVVSFVGTFLGLLGGILLATHVTAVESFIEHIFHIKLVATDVYYVNFLPSRLDWLDVTKVCFAALSMGLISTIYPAWRASKTQPAEALRYE